MSTYTQSPLGRHVDRKVGSVIDEALADTRVVLVVGPRQCGKSTLVAHINKRIGGQWNTLDNATTRDAALADPDGFARSAKVMIIDEVQRAPELLLSIKERVDQDGTPGQFLLTGSARVLGLKSVPDSLPGRIETVELWPLSQGELDGAPETFIDRLFSDEIPIDYMSSLAKKDYIERLVAGGFPGAVARKGKRRGRFLDDYTADIVNRDVVQLSQIHHGRAASQIVALIAGQSGSVTSFNSLANSLGVSRDTVAHYVSLLESVFLVRRIPAWSRNLSTRATATPKIVVTDSGVAANVLGQDAGRLGRVGAPLGGLMEGFVGMELARQLAWSDARVEMFHYRTRDQVEVDLVLEDRLGRVAALEVKSGSTVRGDDFRGIRHLQKRLGDDFLAGIVFHTGPKCHSFGDKLYAVPISAIWEM